MSSDKGNVWERLFKLWATVCKLLVDGKRNPEKVAEALQQIVDETVENPYLRQIATGELAETDGKRTIVGARQKFPGYFDNDFENWGTNVPGKVTPRMPFTVYEQIKDGKFAEIFAVFGRNLDELCWEQDKILDFIEIHPELLHPKGWATFFLFKVGEEFFVASVLRNDDGQLEANVRQLSHGNVWNAEKRYRFVVPQLPS